MRPHRLQQWAEPMSYITGARTVNYETIKIENTGKHWETAECKLGRNDKTLISLHLPGTI